MNKAELLAALESDVKEIQVDAVNAVLRFKLLTGRARDSFHAAVSKGDGALSAFEAAIVAACVVDATGIPLFSAEDVETLRDKNADAVSAVAKVARQVNNIGLAAEEAAAKN